MNSTVEIRRRQLANSLFGARRALRFVLGNVALVGVLVAYCELCSVLNGTPAPGLCISVPWAIQVSLGWIIIGASLGTLGQRMVTMRYASSHPRAFIIYIGRGPGDRGLCCVVRNDAGRVDGRTD